MLQNCDLGPMNEHSTQVDDEQQKQLVKGFNLVKVLVDLYNISAEAQEEENMQLHLSRELKTVTSLFDAKNHWPGDFCAQWYTRQASPESLFLLKFTKNLPFVAQVKSSMKWLGSQNSKYSGVCQTRSSQSMMWAKSQMKHKHLVRSVITMHWSLYCTLLKSRLQCTVRWM